jgi:hypothetical protein
MIDKNVNIIKDPKIKRIVDYNEGDKQINILDQRFYRRGEEYYPSVTSVLNYFPKNQFFHSWLKDVGHNSEIIANKAAGEGTQTHNAIERFINGEEIGWIDEFGNARYSLEVWKMILKFADFWNTYKPELVAAEYHVFSDVSKYAGTVDLVVRINKKLWLIDTKTSNSLHTAHNLQLAAYAMAWNETHTEPIEETGILWLKASTRGEGKGENIQGKGWQLKQIGDVLTNFRMFQNIYEIFKLENPNYRPMTESLPTTIKIAE